MNVEEIHKKLIEPFSPSDIEWRVQQAGKSNNKIWCMVLAYIDARAIQKRLDDIFTPFGWEDSYQCVNDDFICTLTIDFDGKKVSKQNGASKTAVEGFKGGISNSFKRVCASGFGIGRYLYDLDVMFAETTIENPKDDKHWKKSSLKDKQSGQYVTYWFKIPSLPYNALPKQYVNTNEIQKIKDLLKLNNKDEFEFLKYFKVEKFSDLDTLQYNEALRILNKGARK